MQQHDDRNRMNKSSSGGLPSMVPGNSTDDKGNNKSPAGCGSPSARASEYGSVGTPNLDLDEDEDDFDGINLQSNSGSNNQFSNSLLSGSSSGSFLKSSTGLSELNLLREARKPAGLKNVGNTCWFNSIIQAFFHLPYLRNLILSFQISDADISQLEENSRNVVHFVLELRKLFALMLKSKRKAINPNPTLRCLRNCSKYDVELFNQEDVSEFATILVNLIEESFDILDKLQEQKSAVFSTPKGLPVKNEQSGDVELPVQFESLISPLVQTAPIKISPASVESSAIGEGNQLRVKNKKNPIVKLLNGDILINRTRSGEEESNSLIEVFREVNIQMLNARNLHAGLELEWGETSIDKLITPNTCTNTNNNSQLAKLHKTDTDPLNKSIYQQESWIVQLPPVLFICLNRYKFVKATQSSSKILEPFEFEQHIYLDRYMYSNRDAVKMKRKELQLLCNDLAKLESKLKSIKNYEEPSTSSNQTSHNKYALDDILKCTLSFVTTDHSLDEVFNSIIPVESDSPEVKEAEKVAVVKDCLKSWIGRLEGKINELTESIRDVKAKIENIFDVPELKRVKYDLHSVCIHEGNAMSGHFWTYIWNTQQLKWYKFNDTEVSDSNWENLYQNAIGGSINTNNQLETEKTTQPTRPENLIDSSGTTNEQARQLKPGCQPSAYFLIYVKAEDKTLYQENNQTVNKDLVKLIEDDYENLKKQIFNLRLKKLQRDCIDTLKKSNTLIEQANQSSSNPITDQNNQTCIEHVKAFKDSIIDCFTRSFERISSNQTLKAPFGTGQAPTITLESSGVQEALTMALEIELNKYTESEQEVVAKLPDIDLRTQHILTYLSCNNVPREVRVIALYDLFRIQIFAENNIKLKLIQILSQIKFNECILAALQAEQSGSGEVSLYRSYEKWQNDFRDFRSIVAAFINAANFMEYHKYEEAATFYCVACEYNERITDNLAVRMKGMDHEFLLQHRRNCLKTWSQSVIRKIARGSQATVLEVGVSSRGVGLDSGLQHQPLSQQDMTALIELMMSKFLPCFFRLGNAGSTIEDKAMVDEIRQDWLTVLDSNLPELQVFHDFMAKLFEDQIVNHFHSLNVNKTMLTSRYKEAVQLLKRIR